MLGAEDRSGVKHSEPPQQNVPQGADVTQVRGPESLTGAVRAAAWGQCSAPWETGCGAWPGGGSV